MAWKDSNTLGQTIQVHEKDATSGSAIDFAVLQIEYLLLVRQTKLLEYNEWNDEKRALVE
jgi:hypothetical protein